MYRRQGYTGTTTATTDAIADEEKECILTGAVDYEEQDTSEDNSNYYFEYEETHNDCPSVVENVFESSGYISKTSSESTTAHAQTLDDHGQPKKVSVVTFCDKRNEIVLLNSYDFYHKIQRSSSDQPGNHQMKNWRNPSQNMIRNPYGPPLYQHCRITLPPSKAFEKDAVGRSKSSTPQKVMNMSNCTQNTKQFHELFELTTENNKSQCIQGVSKHRQTSKILNFKDKESPPPMCNVNGKSEDNKQILTKQMKYSEFSLATKSNDHECQHFNNISLTNYFQDEGNGNGRESTSKEGYASKGRQSRKLFKSRHDCTIEPVNKHHAPKRQHSAIQRSFSTHRSEHNKKIDESKFPEHPEKLIDISNLDISSHDKRILELLSLKYQKLKEADRKAHIYHLKWQHNLQRMEDYRAEKDLEWKNLIQVKRKQENEINHRKLLEAKKRFVHSQNYLRSLILKRQQKREEMCQTAIKQKEMTLAAWRHAEEAKRIAVEEALQQLLARDTQYRKELKGHIECRLETAKERRKYHREQYRQVNFIIV